MFWNQTVAMTHLWDMLMHTVYIFFPDSFLRHMLYFACIDSCAHRDHKRATDPLKLELQRVVSSHAGTGN